MHEIDPAEQALDTMAPAQVQINSVVVLRQVCHETSGLEFEVVPPTDDRTPADKLGYRVEFGAGAPDRALFEFDDAPVRLSDSTLYLQWIDRDLDQPLDFDVRLSAVDLAGNLGPASDPVRITHEGE